VDLTKKYIRVNQQTYDTLHNEYNSRAYNKSSCEEKLDILGGSVLKYAKIFFEDINALEIGPGSGEILSYFEQHGCRTIAVELSPKMAEIAETRSPYTVFILGDILETEFANDQFEVIYAGAVIHLFPRDDAIELLTKMYKWLKPNGLLFVNTTIHSSSEESYQTKYDYKIPIKRFRKKWTEEEFSNVIKSCGFEVVKRLFTDEKDRGKKWVAFIVQKRKLHHESKSQ